MNYTPTLLLNKVSLRTFYDFNMEVKEVEIVLAVFQSSLVQVYINTERCRSLKITTIELVFSVFDVPEGFLL